MAGVSSKSASKRKIADENRSFQEKWEDEFCFISGHKEGTAICLICRETVVGIKRYNLFRHYTSKHSSFTEAFPLESNERKNKVAHLKLSIRRQQNIMTTAVGQNDAVTKASYQVCNILAKRMKPFTDAELIKECMLTISQTLFQNFSNGKQIMAEVKKLTLSESTCRRRVEDISKTMFDAIIQKLKDCKYFSLACDSSTDITSMAQCSLFVRYCTMDGIIEEDFLALITMKGQTRASDYMDVIKDFVEKYDIPVSKLISVCTDGCPSMVGANNGLIALMKREWNLPNLLPIHCLLHQETLACQISNNKLKDVMKTVINIINFIRARELNHRKFKELLGELQANYGDVLLHTAVRWLSKGKVLERFFNLKFEIILFLQQSGKEYPQLQNDEWWVLMAFLTDITLKFNNLNLELQGPNKIIGQMTNKIFAFEAKLQLYISELEARDFSNFPSVATLRSDVSIGDSVYQDMVSFLKEYLAEIQKRFNDVRNIRNCFILVENPWHFENGDIKLFSQLGFPKPQLLNEIIELKFDTQLKAHFIEHREKQEYVEFWRNVPNNYKCLRDCAQFILTIFPSTYLCEASFSKMTFLKNKYRNRLSSHLEDTMRISCSPKEANIEEIVKKMQHHNS
ncbi:general transcription factor II-I repeat domain-containing protein 2-like [Maniola jurtina]|uniref:general transcription factor II-I repeat domain-containing protein 2-like n=1 Tax=Maniola jurtina TaxID=191418 RepID=UPI001E686608|nr:general transcription factor II-I repeat domain-containing protein 2-like [Maniola jurtina]